MTERAEFQIESEANGNAWGRRPLVREDFDVLGSTDDWLQALPKGVRPIQLQTRFPRITNDLARLWSTTTELDRYFEDKEFSPRDDRQGFAPLIKEELLVLHLYSLYSRAGASEERALRRIRH